MHIPTVIKKCLFSTTRTLLLSDKVRNSTYCWAWEHLRNLPSRSLIIDIGSRDSLFPVFLSWQRYLVRVIERDARYCTRQVAHTKRWHVPLIVDNCDFLAATIPGRCDAICSLFSLQHAGDDDIAGYRYAAQNLRSGGIFLSATEYRHEGTRFHYGRDDGTMRIYGPDDVDGRIVTPLIEEGMAEIDRWYMKKTTKGDLIESNDSPEECAILYLLFRKG